MKMLLKKITSFLLCACLLVLMTGCDSVVDVKRKNKPKYNNFKANEFLSQTVAENSRFKMDWDNENKSIHLVDLAGNKTWSTAIPLQKISEITDSNRILRSDLVIDFVKQYDVKYQTAFSSDEDNCIRKFEAIQNGLRITYNFKKQKISIPVDYLLTENGMKVTVDYNKIAEGKKYMLYRVSVAPQLMNMENYSEDGYFFIPSGQGTLSFPSNGVVTNLSSSVYGRDLAVSMGTSLSETEQVYMPVYGMKSGKDAIFAILEEGEESASIEHVLNDDKLSISFSYATFYARGYEEVEKKAFTASAIKSYIYNKEIADVQVALGFYPLHGEEANYSGMAKVYKEFIQNKYGESDKSKTNSPLYSVKFLGAVDYNDFLFGIPYSAQFALTTLDEADKIAKELKKETKMLPLVQLMGFTKDGLENNRLAGGFKICSKLGKTTDLADLQKEYFKNNSAMIFDFDILNFSKSANGFSKRTDIAKTTNGEKAVQYRYHMALRVEDKSHKNYYLLARDRISDAVNLTLKRLKSNGLSAASLSTLGNAVYSDNNARTYFSKGNMADEYIKAGKSLKKNDIISAANSPNEYAAAMTDFILDAPIQSSRETAMDIDIPFYQMVFGSRVPVYINSLNLSANEDTAFLKAVESGSGLGFTLTANYSTELLNTTQSVLFGTDYNGLKTSIAKYVSEYDAIYRKIKNSEIIKHEIISDNLRATHFENGYVIYTNYGESAEKIGNVCIAPHGFICLKEVQPS